MIKDWYQTLSWKLGLRRGMTGRSAKCPWWADRGVFALAYMEGMAISNSSVDSRVLPHDVGWLARDGLS